MLTGAFSLHLRGILHAHEGRYEEAAGAFLRAIEMEPELVGSYVELGMVHARRGEYAEMVEALRRAVGVGASAVRAYLGERPLGDVPTEPPPDTLRHAEAGTEGGPEIGHSLAALVMSHLATGRDEEAAGVLERALKSGPGRPPALVALLTLAYLLRGEFVESHEDGIRRGGAPTVPGE